MGRKESQEDEAIQLDLSGLKATFGRVKPETYALWGLLLVAFFAVIWVHLVPLSLPVSEDWAQQTIQNGLRGQIAQQVSQQYPNLPETNKNALVEKQLSEYLAQNAGQIAAAEAQFTEQIKSQFQYTGDDGKQYTYLGDLDSYFWLRYTRNWLNTGTVCDKVVDGGCKDMYILAPIGSPTGFFPTLHVFAIGILYKIITVFNPSYPLPATSFLVPVIIAALGVIPAFFIGRRLAGNVGGFVAALVISFHPLVLSRSIGSDNDVWNITVPLYIMWMAVEIFEAKTLKRKLLFTVLTSLAVAIYTMAWDAWWFIYLIVLAGIAAHAGYRLIRAAVRKRARFWQDEDARTAALILAVFYVASFILVTLVTTPTYRSGGGAEYFKLPLWAVGGSTHLDRAIADEYWPNVLTTVAELNKADLGTAIGQMGGKLFFFAGLAGILLMILPRKRLNWQHYAILAAGLLVSLWLVNNPPTSKYLVLLLLVVPVGITLFIYLFREEQSKVGDALIVLVWFLATVYATYSGIRFILLMVPAFGIGFAVTVGRMHEWITEYLNREFKWHETLVACAVFVLVLFLVAQPVRAGYGTARSFVPTIDDGWWDALTKIRTETAPDAIINSWWDFGHWFKYVADRRVTADGTTQHTHVPRWLGLALVTPSEHTSVGVLRMLDCGSDLYPAPEGEHGAYAKLVHATGDAITAQKMLVDIVELDKPDAAAYMKDAGLTQAQTDDVLASTHCDPPEDYFITSGDMVGKAGVWAHFGLWDFDKAFDVSVVQGKTQEEAIAAMMDRHDWTRERAQQTYFSIRALKNEGEINAYVSPWPGYYTQNWLGCQDMNTSLVCPVQLGISQQGTSTLAIDAIAYNVTNRSVVLIFGTYQNGQRVQQATSLPGMLIVADEDGMRTTTFNDSQVPGIGVLIDTVEKRVLIAEPHLAASVFTQLFYLDGRYAEHYVKFDERPTIGGQRVVVWKIDWSKNVTG